VAEEPDVPSLSDSFEKVAVIGASTVEEAAGLLPCAEHATGLPLEQSVEMLREMVGADGGVSDEGWCEVPDRLVCGRLSSTSLRAMCPFACTCWEGILGYAGPFGTPSFGCPEQCVRATHLYVALLGSMFPCEDTGPANFTAETGYLPNAYSLFQEWGWNSSFRFFYLEYVSGLQEYVTGVATVSEGVESSTLVLSNLVLRLSELQLDSLRGHVLGGGFFEELAAGSWNLLPGTPHPRGLTGCDFLASYEVGLALNLDLCDEGKIASIRPWCPRACGCEWGMAGCPEACE
jgi:hypothetical protein